MNDFESDPFLCAARELTRVTIAGEIIDPNQIEVKVSAAVDADCCLLFVIEVGSAAVYHELQQAGVLDSESELEGFIRNDLAECPQDALEGYLEIVRGILGPRRLMRGWLSLFKLGKQVAKPKWILVSVSEVIVDKGKVIFRGVAIRCCSMSVASS